MSRDNETWLAHLGSNNPAQQTALFDLRTALIRNLRSALSNHPQVNDAFIEDIVQDSIVRILERLQQFEGRSRFLTWCTAIAIRVAMSVLRRRQWRDVSLEDVISDTHFSLDHANDNALGPDTEWQRSAVIDKMYDVIQNELTDKQRMALLAELKGMPQEEIARNMGSNRNAIYKLTHDARKRLKHGLETAGYESTTIHATFEE